MDLCLIVSDDGCGLECAGLLRRAIELNLLEPGTKASDPRLPPLIFRPGFSSRELGKGSSDWPVGLDTVRCNIDAAGGMIQVASSTGKGCTFSVRIPLPMTVLEGLAVEVNGDRHVIPSRVVQDVCEDSRGPLEESYEATACPGHSGDQIMPLRLDRLLGGRPAATPHSRYIVLIGNSRGRLALGVDGIIGRQRVLARRFDSSWGKMPGVSATAALLDGSLALILCPEELLALARFRNGESW